MECSFDLLSIKVKLKYPVITSPTCPFMILWSVDFDDSRIGVDYSRLIFIEPFHCL